MLNFVYLSIGNINEWIIDNRDLMRLRLIATYYATRKRIRFFWRVQDLFA